MRPSPLAVFDKLYEHFGPQGWWPVTGSGNKKFEICAGAILTQNTAWANVEKAIHNLNAKGMLTAGRIAAANTGKLAALIKPSGYFNQKAARLKIFASYMLKRGRSGLGTRTDLLSIKGIGPETADSILLYAGNRTTFVIDAYTFRLSKRIGWLSSPDYGRAKEFFEINLPRSRKIYNEYHALIVALGKYFCRKKPLCGGCPLARVCAREEV
jgi:endonuclease-3 related protein